MSPFFYFLQISMKVKKCTLAKKVEEKKKQKIIPRELVRLSSTKKKNE